MSGQTGCKNWAEGKIEVSDCVCKLAQQILQNRVTLGVKPGLSRIKTVLRALGSPEKRLRSTVIISGTNGKGSTAVFLESILFHHGFSTGLYTSPHLISITERVRICGKAVEWSDLARALITVTQSEKRCAVTLTWFELVTAASYLIFAQSNLDVVVLEVGMGGRFDAVNVVNPSVAVLCPISLEHTTILGNTIEQIAYEKAGIIKPGTTVISATQSPEAYRSIRVAIHKIGSILPDHVDFAEYSRRERERKVNLKIEGRDFKGEGKWNTFSYVSENLSIGPLRLGLQGDYQIQNAAVAVAAAEAFLHSLDKSLVAKGLKYAFHPGRFQQVKTSQEVLILDGAHNPAAMEQLVHSFAQEYGECSAALVAIKADKNAKDMISKLATICGCMVLTRLPQAEGWAPAAVAAFAPKGAQIFVVEDLKKALDNLRECVRTRACLDGDSLHPGLICGSLYLVGPCLKLLGLNSLHLRD